jgi:hypothetical protein
LAIVFVLWFLVFIQFGSAALVLFLVRGLGLGLGLVRREGFMSSGVSILKFGVQCTKKFVSIFSFLLSYFYMKMSDARRNQDDGDDDVDWGISEAEQKAALARLQILVNAQGPATASQNSRRGALIVPNIPKDGKTDLLK